MSQKEQLIYCKLIETLFSDLCKDIKEDTYIKNIENKLIDLEKQVNNNEKIQILNYLLTTLFGDIQIEGNPKLNDELNERIEMYQTLENDFKYIQESYSILQDDHDKIKSEKIKLQNDLNKQYNILLNTTKKLNFILNNLYTEHHLKKTENLDNLKELLQSYKIAYKNYRSDALPNEKEDFNNKESADSVLYNVQQSTLSYNLEEDDYF